MSTVCADRRLDIVAVASFAALQRFRIVRRGRSVEIDQGSSSATDHPAVIAQAIKPVRPP
jgi:deoxyadenosine/deoxycytidine kinase